LQTSWTAYRVLRPRPTPPRSSIAYIPYIRTKAEKRAFRYALAAPFTALLIVPVAVVAAALAHSGPFGPKTYTFHNDTALPVHVVLLRLRSASIQSGYLQFVCNAQAPNCGGKLATPDPLPPGGDAQATLARGQVGVGIVTSLTGNDARCLFPGATHWNVSRGFTCRAPQ